MHQISQFNLYHVCPSGSGRIWIYLTQTGPQLRTLMHPCLSFKNFIMCMSIRGKYVKQSYFGEILSLWREGEGRWVGEGVGFRVSSTDKLFVELLHSQPPKQESVRVEEERPHSCVTCTSACPPCSVFLLAPPPPLLSCSHNGLKLMQIYSRFISGCLPSADGRNVAQHQASKMSSLTQQASLDSQSLSLTILSLEEINAVVGPGWLQLCFLWVSICGYQVSSNMSRITCIWTPSPLLLFDPFGSALCVVMGL